jgi:hypothetical protein
MPEYPDEDVRTFIREHLEAGYMSRQMVEREMDTPERGFARPLMARHATRLYSGAR